ncbi:MAG: carbonic anhydrase [Burkholderiales bacterium]|nr:carbonic anhydrase [Burkholderiales bacterium]
MKKILAALVVAAGLTGCASVAPSSSYTTMDKAAQSATTADAALAALKAGNARFVSGNMIKRDLMKQVKATGYGQYPIASIVSCIDSRAGPEIVFDQGIGDVFSARVAGNFVNEDILGSLEFGSKAAGSKLIVVLGHTSCGAIKGACDDVMLGNLTGMLAKIKPAVSSVSSTGDRSSKNDAFVQMVAEANVKRTVNDIFVRSPVLKAMADKGEIKIVGAMLDVKTGVVSWY